MSIGRVKTGYTARWTEDMFIVSSIKYTNSRIYKIKDYNEDKIQGTFFKQVLQKTKQEVLFIKKFTWKEGKRL